MEGIFIAAVTPFKNDQVDFAALKQNLQTWCKTDISGILALGSTSEFVFLNTEEKIRIIAAARNIMPPEKTLIAGIGCESVAETVRLGHAAAELGVKFLIAVNPHYYKPQLKEDVLRRYFTEVAERVTVPLLIYNIPKFTGIHLSLDLIRQLAEHENIIGIKDSSGNLEQYLGLMELNHFKVFTGDLNSLVQTTLMGVDGGIFALANAVPQQICDVFKLVKQDHAREAIKIHRAAMKLARSAIGDFGLAGLKKLLQLMGYAGGQPRLPFAEVSTDDAAKIKQAYERFRKEME